MKKIIVLTTLFAFFLCSTFSFCYATSSQASGNSLKGTLIAKEDKKEDKKEKKEKIEKLEDKIKKLKEDKEKIEKEIKENEKELKKLSRKKKS